MGGVPWHRRGRGTSVPAKDYTRELFDGSRYIATSDPCNGAGYRQRPLKSIR